MSSGEIELGEEETSSFFGEQGSLASLREESMEEENEKFELSETVEGDFGMYE